MSTILDRIAEHKRSNELPRRMRDVPLPVVQSMAAAAAPPRDLIAALRARPAVALIAEVKRASPSRGLLRADFDPIQLADAYASNGAAAISVLTDAPFFQGDLAHLEQIRAWVDSLPQCPNTMGENKPAAGPLPLLRKDFIIHPYQVYETRASGADAVLLIAALLDTAAMGELLNLTHEMGMQALVEVHSADELLRVMPLRPRLVGVNNRDLHHFSVNLNTCLSLRRLVPPETCFVAESGILTPADVARLKAGGVHAMLVGEALVVAPDVAARVRELVHGTS